MGCTGTPYKFSTIPLITFAHFVCYLCRWNDKELNVNYNYFQACVVRSAPRARKGFLEFTFRPQQI
jgi:hypothetical protein